MFDSSIISKSHHQRFIILKSRAAPINIQRRGSDKIVQSKYQVGACSRLATSGLFGLLKTYQLNFFVEPSPKMPKYRDTMIQVENSGAANLG